LKAPFVIIDLCKKYSVTGVSLNNQKWYQGNPGTFEILVSDDVKKWQLTEKHENVFIRWEATVAKFSAGIQLPGVEARFVKIVLKSEGEQALHLKHIQV